jgi:hypothetical protein
MKTKTMDKALKNDLRERVVNAWQVGNGGKKDQVYILDSDNGLAVIISKALYQAEIVLFRNTPNSNRALDQYLRSLLESIADELLPFVEEYSGQSVDVIMPLIDVKAGWMTIFYKF